MVVILSVLAAVLLCAGVVLLAAAAAAVVLLAAAAAAAVLAVAVGVSLVRAAILGATASMCLGLAVAALAALGFAFAGGMLCIALLAVAAVMLRLAILALLAAGGTGLLAGVSITTIRLLFPILNLVLPIGFAVVLQSVLGLATIPAKGKDAAEQPEDSVSNPERVEGAACWCAGCVCNNTCGAVPTTLIGVFAQARLPTRMQPTVVTYLARPGQVGLFRSQAATPTVALAAAAGGTGPGWLASTTGMSLVVVALFVSWPFTRSRRHANSNHAAILPPIVPSRQKRRGTKMVRKSTEMIELKTMGARLRSSDSHRAFPLKGDPFRRCKRLPTK